MTSRIAVICWEESRPWVSALRQKGYSVPWVEEPKGDIHKELAALQPDLVVVDLTKLPDLGKQIIAGMGSDGLLDGVPVVAVSEEKAGPHELASSLARITLTNPSGIVPAVEGALAKLRA